MYKLLIFVILFLESMANAQTEAFPRSRPMN